MRPWARNERREAGEASHAAASERGEQAGRVEKVYPPRQGENSEEPHSLCHRRLKMG